MRWGPYYDVDLREFTYILTKLSFGCHLLEGPLLYANILRVPDITLCGTLRFTVVWHGFKVHFIKAVKREVP